MRARSLGALGFLLALAFAIGLSSCSSGDSANGAEDHAFTNESAGISLEVPRGWHATTHRFTGLIDPRERLTLTSFRVNGDSRSRQCSPDKLLEQMPPTGVAASLREYMDAPARRHVDPRPHPFRLPPVGGVGGLECFLPPPGADAYLFNFGESGRAIQVLVAVGKKVTPKARLAAERALDSLRVEPCDQPLPSEEAPLCRRPLPH